MQSEIFGDEGWGGTDSFPLFQNFFHSIMEKKKKKLLEFPCKFYNYFWAGKEHVILRSENKMFQFFTRSTSGFFQGVSLHCSNLTSLLNETPAAGFCRSQSSYLINCSAAWHLVQPGHWSSLQQPLKIKHQWLRVFSALDAENKICIHTHSMELSLSWPRDDRNHI